MTKQQKTIIIVDDNDANLTACKKILKPYYAVYPAPSAALMFEVLDHVIPDMILLDIEMPDTDGYEAARMLKSNDAFKNIPIIFLTARNDAISEMEGLNLGARDYIHKPFVSALLLRRLETHMSLIDYQKLLEEQNASARQALSRKTTEIPEQLNAIITTLNDAAHSDDPAHIKDCVTRANTAARQLLAFVNKTPV
jgi:putative two-component system response regulator